MEPQNNPRFLFISICLLLYVTSARSRLAPGPSPTSSPSPSPVPNFPPSISPSPSDDLSVAPEADNESYSDQPALFEDLQTNIMSASDVDFSASLLSVGPNRALSKICDNTDHPPLCLATILPFIKVAGKINVESVLRFAVEAGSEYAKEALSVAKNLVSKHETSPELLSTLKDCKESYDVAVENFAKTIDAFASNDIGTMRSVLSAVITFVGDCEDEFADMQTQSPLSGYAEKLTDMTSNCLAIVSQMN